MAGYNSMVRPVANESESISVKFGVTLRQIIDVVREPSTPFYCVTVCCTSPRVWGILHTESHTQPFFLWFEYSQSRLSVTAHKGHFNWCTLWEPGWLQDGLDSPTQEFTKELKALLKDFGPSRDDATVQLLQIGQLHICDATSSTASQRFSDWHCAPEASLRWFELCVVACS